MNNQELLIEPQFYNYEVLLKNPPIVFRFDENGKRKYFSISKQNQYIEQASVTTVLDKAMKTPYWLEQWRADYGLKKANEMMKQAAHYGTLLHICLSDFIFTRKFNLGSLSARIFTYIKEKGLTHDTYNWETKLKHDIYSFAKFVSDYQVEPLAVEIVLLSEKRKYGGGLDLVCKMRIGSGENGRVLKTDIKVDKDGTIIKDLTRTIKAIVDFKSGRHGFSESNEAQLHMYKNLWMEFYPHVPIDRVFNWAPKDWDDDEVPSYYLKDQTQSIEQHLINHYVAIYYSKVNKPLDTFHILKGDVVYGAFSPDNLTIESYEQAALKQYSDFAQSNTQKAIVKPKKEELLKAKDIPAPVWTEKDVVEVVQQTETEPNLPLQEVNSIENSHPVENFGIDIEEVSFENIANLFKEI